MTKTHAYLCSKGRIMVTHSICIEKSKVNRLPFLSVLKQVMKVILALQPWWHVNQCQIDHCLHECTIVCLRVNGSHDLSFSNHNILLCQSPNILVFLSFLFKLNHLSVDPLFFSYHLFTFSFLLFYSFWQESTFFSLSSKSYISSLSVTLLLSPQ